MAEIDWDGFYRDIEPVEIITDRRQVRMKSRDYFWYSPILYDALKDCAAEALVMVTSQAEIIRVASACAKWRVPVTLRGGGTGNYGQAVPLAGGIILDMTGLNAMCEIEPGRVRVHAGMLISDLEDRVRATGQELMMWPSTKHQATIGGFIAGGSAGVGSVRHGVLRDDGNVKSLRIVTLEDVPQIITLEGPDIQKAHHAYGTNGIITELELALVPATDWVHLIALFDDYRALLDCGIGLCNAPIDLYLLSTVDKRFSPHYRSLGEYFPATSHAAFIMVSPDCIDSLKTELSRHGGRISLAGREEDLAARGLPPAYECAYNHTTFQVLKSDRTWTYLQIAYPQPYDPAIEEEIMAEFEAEMYYHHEFARERGDLQVFSIPLVKWSTRERLYEMAARFEDKGCTVFDAHSYTIAGGGMKVVDQTQVAFKRIADPSGLMNPGKTSDEEARLVRAEFGTGGRPETSA